MLLTQLHTREPIRYKLAMCLGGHTALLVANLNISSGEANLQIDQPSNHQATPAVLVPSVSATFRYGYKYKNLIDFYQCVLI